MGDILITEAVNHAKLIGHLRQVLPELTHRDTVLTDRAKFPGGGQQVPAGSKLDPRTLERRFLTIILLQFRFGIKQINMRRATVHEEENDPLGTGFEMRLPGDQRMSWNGRCRKSLAMQQIRQGQASEPDTPGSQQIPPAG